MRKWLMACSVLLMGTVVLSRGADQLPDGYLGFQLGEAFAAAKLNIPDEKCSKLNQPKHVNLVGKEGTTWGVYEFRLKGAGDKSPLPLATDKSKQYQVWADLTAYKDGTLACISVKAKVGRIYTTADIEKSLMEAYKPLFIEKKEPSGTYKEWIFRDAKRELIIGYADGGYELSVEIHFLENE